MNHLYNYPLHPHKTTTAINSTYNTSAILSSPQEHFFIVLTYISVSNLIPPERLAQQPWQLLINFLPNLIDFRNGIIVEDAWSSFLCPQDSIYTFLLSSLA